MGRAIIREPSVFLMDEPLSNLDAKLRVQMRAEIASLQSRLGVTTVYVTHDQSEAMTLGDRVAVLGDGPPPAMRRAAGALRAAREHVRRRLHRLAGDEPVHAAGSPMTAPSRSAASASGCRTAPAADARGDVVVGLRPEALELADDGIAADVEVVEEIGADAYVFASADARRRVDEARRPRRGEGRARTRRTGLAPAAPRRGASVRSPRPGRVWARRLRVRSRGGAAQIPSSSPPLRAGDEETFARLVREWHPSLLRVAQIFVPSRAIAEEVVQETWLRVLGALDRFEGRSSLKTWVFRILVNTAKTRAQREGRVLPFSALNNPGRIPEAAVDPGPLPAGGRRPVPRTLVGAAARAAGGTAAGRGDARGDRLGDRRAARDPGGSDPPARRRRLVVRRGP